jgi:hypothetical protein
MSEREFFDVRKLTQTTASCGCWFDSVSRSHIRRCDDCRRAEIARNSRSFLARLRKLLRRGTTGGTDDQ